jgi:hypothetical protein
MYENKWQHDKMADVATDIWSKFGGSIASPVPVQRSQPAVSPPLAAGGTVLTSRPSVGGIS